MFRSNNYYVYALIDPRDNQIFYIGKGKGRRIKAHNREKSHKVNNITKFLKIEEIKRKGLKIKEQVLFTGLSENDAFKLEHIIIYKIGRQAFGEGPLTNFVPGGTWKKGDSLFYESPIDLNFDLSKLDFVSKQIFLDINHTSKITHLSDLNFLNFHIYKFTGELFCIMSKTCFFKNYPYAGVKFLYNFEPLIFNTIKINQYQKESESLIVSTFHIKNIYTSKYLLEINSHYFDAEFYKKLDLFITNKKEFFQLTSKKIPSLSAEFDSNQLILKSDFNNNRIENYYYLSNGIFQNTKPENPEYNSTVLDDMSTNTTQFVYEEPKPLTDAEIKERDKASKDWNDFINYNQRY